MSRMSICSTHINIRTELQLDPRHGKLAEAITIASA
jgi:hypothetical protein